MKAGEKLKHNQDETEELKRTFLSSLLKADWKCDTKGLAIGTRWSPMSRRWVRGTHLVVGVGTSRGVSAGLI
jgi:hypothetical protein